MKIKVKSNPGLWYKEKKGIKNNTVRKIDSFDLISVQNTHTGEIFTRPIKDISVYDGRIIITWESD